MPHTSPLPVTGETCRKWNGILEKYRLAKQATQKRIIASENWWKLRNEEEIRKEAEIGRDGGFVSRSSWLHNVIANKHADAMENYPEPIILPREEGDTAEAKMLQSIIPCILEQNGFEDTYDSVEWTKCKSGTGVYKVFWDRTLHGGLGDIRVEEINPLNVYWQPGTNRIQKSRYFFQVELQDRDLLEEAYPQLRGMETDTAQQLNYALDEKEEREGRLLVVEVYYHKHGVLHYCRYVGTTVLYATENDDTPDIPGGIPMCERGLYDHGKYPFVTDALFPIAGSPFGYGYVDINKNPQLRIDLMDTAFVKNVIVNAIPRFLCQDEGNIREDELLDLSRPIIHVAGRVDEASLRQLSPAYLQGNALNMLERTVRELRETSGNTDAGTGNTPRGVTAASAIAALQEASGKGSRDAARGSHRAYREIVLLVIELIRQFYTLPRKFRILGENGASEYIRYGNQGLVGQAQTVFTGEDMGLRLPEFDVKVCAQRANLYTRISQNELGIQMYQLGFFNPQRAGEALLCLGMMDFEGKSELIRRISENAAVPTAAPGNGVLVPSLPTTAHPSSPAAPVTASFAHPAPNLPTSIPAALDAAMLAAYSIQPNGGEAAE